MLFVLCGFNGRLNPIEDEKWANYAAARERAAALLVAGLAGADTVAVCEVLLSGATGGVIAYLTTAQTPWLKATEWPGVWQWGMSPEQREEQGRAQVGRPSGAGSPAQRAAPAGASGASARGNGWTIFGIIVFILLAAYAFYRGARSTHLPADQQYWIDRAIERQDRQVGH